MTLAQLHSLSASHKRFHQHSAGAGGSAAPESEEGTVMDALMFASLPLSG